MKTGTGWGDVGEVRGHAQGVTGVVVARWHPVAAQHHTPYTVPTLLGSHLATGTRATAYPVYLPDIQANRLTEMRVGIYYHQQD